MTTASLRATRSNDNPPYNSDSPRKRTRYSSSVKGSSRRNRTNPASRSRNLRTPRALLDDGDEGSLPVSSRRVRRATSPNKPRYDSAADAAAAATGQVDGYKPREERSWEEFHQDLSLDTQITIFDADEVDGVLSWNPGAANDHHQSPGLDGRSNASDNEFGSPMSRRRPGRPPRRPEAMLNGLGSPPAPKLVPLPAQNPREKLNLPKPSYRRVNTFAAYEADKQANQMNYVDRTLANVGFQEWENFIRTGQQYLRHVEDSWQDDREPNLTIDSSKVDKAQAQQNSQVSRVEYDMDEQDEQWLEAHNSHRRDVEQVEGIKPPVFEITMTQIEKEWHALERRIPKPNPKPPQTHRPRSSSAAAVNGEPPGTGEEQDSKCAICDDGDCENSNAIVFCDGCDLAVHQECYGVPYIPEGQWLCRKCQMIGVRSKPVCIFCPNFEGAFKQTTENRWAHLLCAIWIPEVSIANQTYQEPISDVAGVPPDRWNRLTCYVCNQHMGACIQCGHRACYTAFHVTCAKRAKLFLRLKASHGTGQSMDASKLKAFCHKHVPDEWQAEHDSDRAVLKAQSYYRKRMKNIEWADSMTSATTAITSQPLNLLDITEEGQDRDDAKGHNNAAALKKKRQNAQKSVWKLQSGAPIVPEVVQEAIEGSLARFGVRKRKEFVAEACKYWTMKRDSRRGAAMLKRLQLQLETFSANEVTRRNFAAMGPIGASRLERRIEMAERLLGDVASMQKICEQMRNREESKLHDAEILRNTVDLVYFPISALVDPVLRKARGTENRSVVFPGLATIQRKVESRCYSSVSAFAVDLGLAFSQVPGLEKVRDIFEAQTILGSTSIREELLSDAEKDWKKLAKRIVKAVQQPMKEALLREAELGGENHTERLQYMRDLSEKDFRSLLSTDALSSSAQDSISFPTPFASTSNMGPVDSGPYIAPSVVGEIRNSIEQPEETNMPAIKASKGRCVDEGKGRTTTMTNEMPKSNDRNEQDEANNTVPDAMRFLEQGGTPWYVEHFEPEGVSLHEERWTGPEVVRGMSEELSEMDETELQGLSPVSEAPESDEVSNAASATTQSRNNRRRRRR